MTKVILIGAGNVAFHLTKQLKQSIHFELVQVYNRSATVFNDALYNDIKTTTSLEDLEEAAIYIIAISDNSIAHLAEKLPQNKLIVHTSGSMPMGIIQGDRSGVFYPLQTFSKAKTVDFSSIPFCLEANTDEDLLLLKKLANEFTTKIYEIDSVQRKSLHVAAVFVNNFTNHLFYQAEALCSQYKVPFEVLLPLITETVNKLAELSPKDAQTGPALRNDTKTMEAHLALLNTKQQKIYTILSQSIQETYGEKL